jgi:hypothetical protein
MVLAHHCQSAFVIFLHLSFPVGTQWRIQALEHLIFSSLVELSRNRHIIALIYDLIAQGTITCYFLICKLSFQATGTKLLANFCDFFIINNLNKGIHKPWNL